MPSPIMLSGKTSAVVAFLLVALGGSDAHACSATEERVVALLPAPDATDVPLNVVLQASSALSRVDFELVDAVTEEPVPLSVSCDGHYDGNLCLASAGPLEPNTAYRWRASSVLDVEDSTLTEERVFVTGDVVDDYTPVVNAWSLDVLDDEPQAPVGCGQGRRVTFEFVAHDIEEQVVLAVPGLLPAGDQHAAVVSPGIPVQFELAVPPQCFSIRVTDMAGNAKALPAYCFESQDEAEAASEVSMQDDLTQDDVRSVAPGRAGCSLAGEEAPPHEQWLSLLLPLVGIVLRRRGLLSDN